MERNFYTQREREREIEENTAVIKGIVCREKEKERWRERERDECCSHQGYCVQQQFIPNEFFCEQDKGLKLQKTKGLNLTECCANIAL